MKTLFFALGIILFVSCTKNGFDLSGVSWPNNNFTITGDSNNKVKADISVGGTNYPLSAVALNTVFSRYVLTQYTDSSIITIAGYDTNNSLEINLINIRTSGTYSFGHIPGNTHEVKAKCSVRNTNGYIIYYNNDFNVLSGTITIDNITDKHIQGSFSVTCWNGTQAAGITNGSFTGNY